MLPLVTVQFSPKSMNYIDYKEVSLLLIFATSMVLTLVRLVLGLFALFPFISLTSLSQFFKFFSHIFHAGIDVITEYHILPFHGIVEKFFAELPVIAKAIKQ